MGSTRGQHGILRLLSKTEIDMKTGCWLDVVSFKDKDGYTKIFHGRTFRTNIFSAWFFHKLDLKNKKLQANHKIHCPNKNCWNPGHIYIGTQAQNIRDSIKLGTWSYPPYLKGEPVNLRKNKTK